MTGPAAARWRRLQQGRGIPPEILATAHASPWRHDPTRFAAPEQPEDNPSRQAAWELLGPAGGTVLDVGCGGGVASLAVRARAHHITAVDSSADMLDEFQRGAGLRAVAHRTVLGTWPEVATEAGGADAVLCHHVGYNTVELGPFVAALGEAAVRGVVCEMSIEHPMAWLDPLWARFHGLRRPPSATLADALAVLAEVGIAPTVTRWERAAHDQPIPDLCRRLCLSVSRADELTVALAELPHRRRLVATLAW